MKPDSKSISGVIVPLATPLDENEDLNYKELERLVDHVIQGGVNGIFAMGTTGEFSRFDDGMQAVVISFTVHAVSNRVPVYAGVSGGGTKAVLDKIEKASYNGADAAVCTMPYYIPNQCAKETTKFFSDIAAGSELPLILYNIPATVGSAIPLESLDELAHIPNIVAIKDSGSDGEYTENLLRRYSDKGLLSVLIGNESALLGGLKSGAAGLVPSMANPFPKLLSALYQSAVRKDYEKLAYYCGIVDRFNELNSFTQEWMGPNIWRKIALDIMGIASERMAQPVLPVDDETRGKIAEAVYQYRELFRV